MSLSQSTIDTVKATGGAVSKHAEAITTKMYEILNAWKEAYFFLADILIAREKKLYAL